MAIIVAWLRRELKDQFHYRKAINIIFILIPHHFHWVLHYRNPEARLGKLFSNSVFRPGINVKSEENNCPWKDNQVEMHCFVFTTQDQTTHLNFPCGHRGSGGKW